MRNSPTISSPAVADPHGWMALRGDQLLARAAWWGHAGHDTPFLLDIFDIDDGGQEHGLDIGVRLLRTARDAIVPAGTHPPEYLRTVPPDWREDAATRRTVENRMAALERAGASQLVERLRLEWRRGHRFPSPADA